VKVDEPIQLMDINPRLPAFRTPQVAMGMAALLAAIVGAWHWQSAQRLSVTSASVERLRSGVPWFDAMNALGDV